MCKTSAADGNTSDSARARSPESYRTLMKAPSTTTEKQLRKSDGADTPKRTNATALSGAGSTSSAATSFFGQFGFRSDNGKMKKPSNTKATAEILDKWRLDEMSSEEDSF